MASLESWCVFLVFVFVVQKIFCFIYKNFLASHLGISAVDVKKSGKWAVITGSTDGIGKAYSEELARKGLNVVLISRTQSKLDAVAKDISERFNVEARTIAIDFTQVGDNYHVIEKHLTGLDIGVLVNNVGMSYNHPDLFLDTPNREVFYANMINCNITSVLNMCQIVMPGMVERKRGIVINLSSASSAMPSPMLSVYSATKSFVHKLSDDLAIEYQRFGITVQAVLPGYVATSMSKIRKSTLMAPTPTTYVKSALRTVGVERTTFGYFPHSLLNLTINLVDSLSPKVANWIVLRTMQNIRGRALRKAMKT